MFYEAYNPKGVRRKILIYNNLCKRLTPLGLNVDIFLQITLFYLGAFLGDGLFGQFLIFYIDQTPIILSSPAESK